MLISSFSL